MSRAKCKGRRFSKQALATLVIACAASPAFGKCSAGGLRFLGTAADQSKTFWLSGTMAGSFRLEAAQQSQTVDTWTKERRGLHLSTSPNVSAGNGGTHKLYDTTDDKECLLDTQNQKGGFIIPPNINLPNLNLPGNALPPIGNLFPGFGRPTLPGRPKPPGGGLTPGLPTRPPGGLMPTLPGGVQPPIGTLPPTGLMPTLPGGVQPPIGTLPPTGLMPTLPGGVQPPIGTLPPTGLMPTLPGGVQPPIGTLPPTGLMPTLPGGVQPPIGTLPPTGLMPTLPGGVQPPIGTLPPTGLMPTLPGSVQPPITTLPPDGLTPGLPGTVQPPVTTLPQDRVPGVPMPPVAALPPRSGVQPVEDRSERERTARTDPCADPRTRTWTSTDGRRVRCPRRQGTTGPVASETPPLEVPLTPGRDLGIVTPWNGWAETNFTGVSDRRYGLDLKTRSGTLSSGLDYRFTNDVVAGLSIAFSSSRTDGFDDSLRSETKGFSIGPYLAVKLSPHIAVDASINYGQSKNDLRLAILSGSSTPQILSGSVNLHGQFDTGPYFVRPKVSVFWSHVRTNAYDISGTLLGLPINVPLPASEFDSGIAQLSGEVSRLFTLSSSMNIMPYLEPSIQYGFLRPNGGELLTGDLKSAFPSAWSGMLRGGVRMSINTVLLEASAGYLSFGQPDLDVWEAKFRFSVGF